MGRMLITVSGVYRGQGENYRTLVDEKQNRTLFIVDLPQDVYLGKSVVVRME